MSKIDIAILNDMKLSTLYGWMQNLSENVGQLGMVEHYHKGKLWLNKNGVLWSQARIRIEIRLRCDLVIWSLVIQSLVIYNMQLVFDNR